MAVAPLLLASIVSIAAAVAPEVKVPLISPFSYTLDQPILLVVFLAGAIMGATRKFPLWSYSWTVMAIGSIASLASVLSVSMLTNLNDTSYTQIGVVSTLIRLGGALLILAFAVSRSSLGLRYAFFVIAVSFAAGSVRMPTFSPFPSVRMPTYSLFPMEPLINPILINAYLIAVTLVELIIVMAMVMRFMTGDEFMQRRAVYVLVAVILLSAILTDWAFYLNSSYGTVISFVLPVAFTVSSKWVILSLSLLITWGLAKGLIYWKRKMAPDLASEGETHAG